MHEGELQLKLQLAEIRHASPRQLLDNSIVKYDPTIPACSRTTALDSAGPGLGRLLPAKT
jgi:hypothetical protein